MAVASLALLQEYARRLLRHRLSAALCCWRLHALKGVWLEGATATAARRVASRSNVPPVDHRRSTGGWPASSRHDAVSATSLACQLRLWADLAAAFGAWARPAMRTAATRRMRHRLASGRLGAAFAHLVAASQWRLVCRHAVRTFVWRGGAMAMRTWLARVAVALSRKFTLRRAAHHWRLRRARASLRALRAHARGAYATCRELSRLRHASDRAGSRALRTWRDAGTLRRLVRGAVSRRSPIDCRRALARWMDACALRLAAFQLHRRTARMLVTNPLRGVWSALRAGGARWAVLRRCVVTRITDGLLRAVDAWREAAAGARLVARARLRWHRAALVAATLAWRGGAAPRRRLCEISARCTLLPLGTALRRWRRGVARATPALQRMHAAAAARRCREAARAFRAWAVAAGAAISEHAFEHRSMVHWLQVELGQGLTLWRQSALRRRRASATLEAGALRWLAMGLVRAMAAWRERTASSVAALWQLHQSAVAWQQQSAVAALSAFWLHAAARRQQQACQLRAARYMLRGTGRYFVAWRVAAGQRAAVLRMAQRHGKAAGGGRSLEVRALRTWRGVCAAAVQVRALTSLVLRGGAGRAMRAWRAAAAERSRRLGAARRCAVDMVHREAGAALRSWAAWRAARGAARAVASHALQRVLRAREAAALAAWREAAAATGRRRRLLRGAVQRFRHTAQARAWHSWAQHGRRPAPPTAQALQRLRRPGLAAALQCWAAHALVLGPLARSQALARAERATHMQLQRSVQRWAGRHRLARAFLCLHRHHALRRAIAAWRAVLSTSSVHRLRALAVLRVRHVPSPKLEAFWR